MTHALVALLALMAAAIALLAVPFARMPLQRAHAATARVVAIAAWEAKFRANRDTIVVRNATGTGEFVMRFDDVRCHVGDVVPVEQRGVTLTRVAKTCR